MSWKRYATSIAMRRGSSSWPPIARASRSAWNRRFYEKAGFGVVAPEHWGEEITREVLFQRRLLPQPEEPVVMRKAFKTEGNQ
jgi:hypothetical protein